MDGANVLGELVLLLAGGALVEVVGALVDVNTDKMDAKVEVLGVSVLDGSEEAASRTS